MPIYGERYLEYVRGLLRGIMDAHHKPTAQSWRYRKRAAELARSADEETDIQEQTELIEKALQWISLAENDEFIAIHRPLANDNEPGAQ
jgi:hypothetical protein